MKLRPYQVDGIDFMVKNKHVLNADEMGLGKSAQSLCAIRNLNAKTSLVLCPGFARRTWRREVKKWRPEATFHIVEGVADAIEHLILHPDAADIIICNYEILPSVLRAFKKELLDDYGDKQAEAMAIKHLKSITFDAVIADEAHYLKHRHSARSIVARGIRADIRYALTGTPITSYVPELWHILHFLDKKKFSSYWRFLEEYCDVSMDFFGHRIVEDNRADKDAIISDFPDIIIRRLKRDHLPELPPVLFEPIYFELSPSERKVYNQMRDLGATVVEGKLHTANVVIAQLQKLQRIAIGLSMLADDEPKTSSMMSLMNELCRDSIDSGKSVIVFSKWSRAIALADAELTRAGIKHHVVTGDVGGRDAIFDEFMDGEPSVLCATIGTAGASLDLQRGKLVIFLDKSWVPAENEQAYSRAHRMGQTEPVTVVSLVAEDTVVEYVEEVLDAKLANIDAALGDSWHEVAKMAFHSGPEGA